jgi:hypothetical protein
MKSILALGILAVAVLIVLALMSVLNYVVAGLLVTATIGIVGWIINYLSKQGEKTILSEDIGKKLEHEQLKQPKIILEETCIVESKDYVFYDLDLDAKETVKGEITSDETINIYFLTKYSFRSFENGEPFSYEYGAESVLRKKIDFKPSKTATWYLVIENEGRDEATVNVNLLV